jgi:hypothetical protein
MTHSLQHAFEAQEVMAYLDGALEPERAAALAAHMEGCGECQDAARSFRQISDRMLGFEVEPVPTTVSEGVAKALEADRAKKPAERATWNRFDFWNWPFLKSVPRNWSIAGVAGFVAIALIFATLPVWKERGGRPVLSALAPYIPHDTRPAPPVDSLAEARSNYPEALERAQNAALSENPEAKADRYTTAAESDESRGQLVAPEISGPMIEQTVSLHIVPTNYDDASAAIEKLAAARGGYVGNLTATAQTGSARDVSVELKIPAKQADGFVADLRKLGHVVEETRSTEEVSAQYVDLQARLNASRAAEKRLIELLGTRTGKLSDVLEVERELARVRSEIESMQGESNVMLHQVNYATVKVQLSEEYHETLHISTSVGGKIRNAFVEGLKNLEEGILAVLVFLLADGLSIAFWLGLFVAAAWLVRKRLRSRKMS